MTADDIREALEQAAKGLVILPDGGGYELGGKRVQRVTTIARGSKPPPPEHIPAVARGLQKGRELHATVETLHKGGEVALTDPRVRCYAGFDLWREAQGWELVGAELPVCASFELPYFTAQSVEMKSRPLAGCMDSLFLVSNTLKIVDAKRHEDGKVHKENVIQVGIYGLMVEMITGIHTECYVLPVQDRPFKPDDLKYQQFAKPLATSALWAYAWQRGNLFSSVPKENKPENVDFKIEPLNPEDW